MAGNSIISGALYDFGAFLTTHDSDLRLGASNDSEQMVALLEEWAAERGYDVNEPGPDVMGWQEGRGLSIMAEAVTGPGDGERILDYIASLSYLPSGDELLSGSEILVRDIREHLVGEDEDGDS